MDYDRKVQDLIKNYKSKEQMPVLLPTMHSTSCLIGEKILQEDKLSVKDCPVFNESLLYYFYGKPAYRVSSKHSHKSRTDCLRSPCCFVLDSKKIHAKYIYPFDTGAYSSGIFEDMIPLEIDIRKFQLQPDPTNIPEYVRVFFGNNINYLQGISNVNVKSLNNVVTFTLGQILSARGSFEFDDRARTVEIISEDSLKLSDAIMAIIVPQPFVRNEVFKDFVKNHSNIDVITYFTRYPSDPASHNEAVFQKAIDYLKKRGGI